MDYSTLTAAKTVAGSIKNWVNRSDLPVDDIVNEAEAWVFGEGGLRVREMIAINDADIDATYVDGLPDDFLDPISLTLDGYYQPIPLVPITLLRQETDEDGNVIEAEPVRWAMFQDTAYFNSAPAETLGYTLLYYARPAALSAGNTTNFLTDRYPGMFRHALLARAYSHMKDYARSLEEEKMAMGKLELIKKNDDLHLRGADLGA